MTASEEATEAWGEVALYRISEWFGGDGESGRSEKTTFAFVTEDQAENFSERCLAMQENEAEDYHVSIRMLTKLWERDDLLELQKAVSDAIMALGVKEASV